MLVEVGRGDSVHFATSAEPNGLPMFLPPTNKGIKVLQLSDYKTYFGQTSLFVFTVSRLYLSTWPVLLLGM